MNEQPNHNQRKLPILLSVFKKYKTAYEVAKETLPPGEDLDHYLTLIRAALSSYRRQYTHPYVIHETLRTLRRKGRVAYKCTDKGKRVACELNYRKKHGISLIWRKSPRRRHGNKINKYYIDCRGNCKTCKYYPFPRPGVRSQPIPIPIHPHRNNLQKPQSRLTLPSDSISTYTQAQGNNQTGQPTSLHIQAQAHTHPGAQAGAGEQSCLNQPQDAVFCAIERKRIPCPKPTCSLFRDCHPRNRPVNKEQ